MFLPILNYLKDTETVIIALMVRISLQKMFHSHSFTSQLIMSDKLCIGSNQNVEYTFTVTVIAANGN